MTIPSFLNSARRAYACFIVFVVLIGGRGVNQTFASPPDSGWVLIWGDEFDGGASNANRYGLDLDKWSSGLPWLNGAGNDRWFSQNDAHWIADECAFVTNGNLVVRSEESSPTTWPGRSTFYYKAGWANTRKQLQYTWGYAEARFQSPDGTAMWPAWWFLGASWPPEVDVFERYPSGKVHQGAYYAGTGGVGTWASVGIDADPIYDMRTWGFEWAPGYMGLSKDGVIRNDFSSPYMIAEPMYMVFSGAVITNGNNGASLASQTFPADFIIDYVRVYKRAEHLYDGNFGSGGAAGWAIASTNTSVSTNGGLGGNNALALGSGADTAAPAAAYQTVYGLIPGTRYWVAANLKAGSSPVYLGVNGPGGSMVERAGTNATYAPESFVFTNGLNDTTADVYVRLNAGPGLTGFADQVQIRRAAAVADPGFDHNNTALYWSESYGSYSISTNSPRSGKRCLALSAAGSAAQQTIHGLQPNTTYQLTGWINSGGKAAYLGVKDFGREEIAQAVNSTAYAQGSVTFTTGANSTTALVYVWLPGYNGTPVYIDDLFLAEPLIAPWQQSDVGAIGLAGAAGRRSASFDIRGAGADMGGAADSFRFVYQPVTNDCRIVARVLKVDPTDPSARAGITLRENTTADARHVTIDWQPQRAMESLCRSMVGGTTAVQLASGKVNLAPWVRIERVGNVFTTAWSPDGIRWTNVMTQTLALPSTVYAGMVVCAQNAAQLNEALFSDVSVGAYASRVADDLIWNGSGTWDASSATWLDRFGNPAIWNNDLADGATFGATGAGTVSIAGNATARSLTFNAPGYTLTGGRLVLAGPEIVANAAATISSPVSGSAGLTKSGADVLALSGTNIYTGGTTIQAGTLKLLDNATLGGSDSTVTVAGGILDLGGANRPAGVVTISGGVISNGTLTAASFNGRSGEANATLAGANASLIKSGGGTLVLSGTNSYSGGTVLNAGTLSISSAAALGGNSNMLTFAGGVLQIAGASLNNLNAQAANWSAFNGGFDIAAAGNTFTITNAIGGTELIKNGAGTLLLTGTSSYPSSTVINGGVLQIGPAGRLYSNGGGPIKINSGGVLSVSGDIGYYSQCFGGLDMQPYALTLDGGTFRHTGPGNAKNAQPGSGRLLMLGVNGGTLESATAGQEFSLGYRYDFGANILSQFGGTLTLAGVGNGDLNYGLGGAGGLIKTGGGTWKLTGTNYTYTGPTVVESGKLVLAAGGLFSSGSLSVSNGATLDVSPVSGFTLGVGQTFSGSGSVTGAVSTVSGARIYPGADGLIGTLTFKNSLILASGASPCFDLSTSAVGANDRLVVGGNLVVSNPVFRLKAPSVAVRLDTNANYALITVTGVLSGTMTNPPVWDIAPWNPGGYSTVISGKSILLVYTPPAIPAAPADLMATAGDGQVVLTWSSVTNATGYKVKRSTASGGPYADVGFVSQAGWTNGGLVNGTLYHFIVAATNTVAESGDSTPVSVRPISLIPTNLTFGISGDRLQLGWPAGHTGWQLQAQTNGAGAGLGTNWRTIVGSTEINQFSIPVDNVSDSVFFRLVSP